MRAQVRKALPAFGVAQRLPGHTATGACKKFCRFFRKKKSITDRETPVMRMTIEIIIFLNNIRYTRDIQKDTAAEWRIISVE